MILDAFVRVNGDVDRWVDEISTKLGSINAQLVECDDVVQEQPCTLALTEGEFLNFCTLTQQRTLFLYRGEQDVTSYISENLGKIYEDGEEPERLTRAFEVRHELLVKRAKQFCVNHFYAEIFVLHQGCIVTTGVMCKAFEELTEALQSFVDDAEGRREEALEARALKDEEVLQNLEEELVKDESFAAIRGKRKRCIYVQERYGERLPHSLYGATRRVDANSDPIDANLVRLVERASDRLSVLKIK